MDKDKYYTPQWCIDAIMREIDWDQVGTFVDPCAGDDRIPISTIAYGNDLMFASFELDRGENYLAFDKQYDIYDLAITNPPFTLWIEFADRLLFEAQSVILLGRLSMLGSQARRVFWDSHPLTHLWVLSKRPSFEGPAAAGNGTDNSEYAWFGWCEDLHIVPPAGIHHLP